MFKERVEVTEEHLKLISNMYFQYDKYTEFGAPEVDKKRPYGNSDVYEDMQEILGIDDEKKLLQLHTETAKVLQVITRVRRFEPGVYESDKYRDNWEKVSE